MGIVVNGHCLLAAQLPVVSGAKAGGAQPLSPVIIVVTIPHIVTGLHRSAQVPGVTTPVKGLLRCGASTFPGIGIPPVAASGAMAAHAIAGPAAQQELLDTLKL